MLPALSGSSVDGTVTVWPAAEDRPSRNPAFRTPAACPARGDRASPSNHTAVAMTVPRRLPGGLAGRPTGTRPHPLPVTGTP
ncbi:hypothetical protein FB563_7571 [Streptomyces puniciscabiei]|uniref:Uncharacterized protein n=1 Tax=Streptomyces puniciscabiei TaxID=164348 RepID=A0A542SYV1_9ACTN|nr:hypothetical protein [Streptomyces puniciscabiei]TQK79722.1 hypothetical protein FB563_7571 [Streptomyces puniciscabiei]